MSNKDKPDKPYPDFPLFPHAKGYWAKKILGKTRYFGRSEDPDAALTEYERVRHDLYSGRTPAPDCDGLSLKDALNLWLHSKGKSRDNGELAPDTWKEYQRVARRIAATLGGAIKVATLTPKGLGNDVAEFKQLGLSDNDATEALSNEIFAHGLIGDSQNAADIGKLAPDAASRMPGQPQLKNPLLQKGAFNPLQPDTFVPTRLGGDVAGFVEDLDRIAPYVAYRKQGYTVDAAAEMVKRIQVDYSNPTHWESKYGRNVIPFYMFSKGMLPLVAKELTTSPGGRMATTLKASARASQDNPQPHWMRGATSVPIGEGHLGGLGIMHDDAASMLGAASSGDVADVAQDIGGRLNPLTNYPLELASGKSLYHGRPLSTIAPDVGGTIHNLSGGEGKAQPFVSLQAEHALRNSPPARYFSTARKATNPNPDRAQVVANLASGLYYAN